ncbi:MAG: YkgJ family cysteine cluster protein [Planctomycetes bacterium]|nr:YkgJ family cysteine cluster protein [Planctomycetota bacterium]
MPDQHDDILRDWRENAARNEDRNFRFLRSLRMAPSERRVDALAGALHQEAFAAIDCTRCANCCKTMKPALIEADLKRISRHLKLSREAFISTYLETDPEEGGYRMRALPCPFLAGDGRCSIYEHRPKACREFPHTDKKGFSWRTYMHADNTLSCPGVYRIVQEMRIRRGRF